MRTNEYSHKRHTGRLIKSSSDETLWTITLLQSALNFLVSYFGTIAKFWNDDSGAGPFTRFLLSGTSTQSVLPAKRVLIFILFGFSLSVFGVWLTDDEYLQGPNSVNNPSDFPVHIAFENVGCKISGIDTPVLQNVTGEIRSGRLTAILGQSGSGKTTFTHALLGRNKNRCNPAMGHVLLNGQRHSLESYLDRVGFVPQEDVLYPELTVEETLRFSADWRLPRHIDEKEKQRLLQQTLDTLDLSRIRHQRVGGEFRRGISGGERKRVSIGMELITNPSVLVMDEPTSGLDSAGAFRLIRTIRSIADKGVSVVAVLHQPSARVFDLIQDLVLLQQGRAVYVGPREKVLHHFYNLDFEIPGVASVKQENTCDGKTCGIQEVSEYDASQASPAEFILDILAGLEVSSRPIDDLSKSWQESDQFKVQVNNIGKTVDELNQTFSQPQSTPQHSVRKSQTNILLLNEWVSYCVRDSINEENVFVFSFCTILRSIYMGSETTYPVLPKPGLNQQLRIWFVALSKLSWRRGIFLECAVIMGLSFVVSFVRSYNNHWNRRPLANFFVSIAIGLLGMLGAVFNDDIGPVRRAATSGMMIGAHEFAVVCHSAVKGMLSCQLFAISFFSFLYLRTGEWCSKPFEFKKYMEWVHMVHLNYMCANVCGSIICVLTNHDPPIAYVVAVATLIAVHVFAFFTPNRNQIENDSMIFGHINTAPMVQVLCSLSYVRYWMEAIVLWEPKGTDRVGRNYALRHYGYSEGHKTMCCTLMVCIYLFGVLIRFMIFSYQNTNLFNSVYDTPLFIIFVGKVVAAHVAALLVATVSHELSLFKQAWVTAKKEAFSTLNQEADVDVDIMGFDSDETDES